jgi:trehalose 6-phosphate synthase/phosphatase
MHMVRRLIIASNRLPVSVREEHGLLSLSRSNGGLATALASLFDQDSSLWVGWTGYRCQLSLSDIESLGLPPYVAPVNLTKKEISGYYDHFSNGILWPLAHGLPMTSVFSDDLWQDVQSVTKRFAEAIESVVRPSDIIWVHDYHLMLLPGMLRSRGIKNRIGFFLHTPFPSPKFAARMPHFQDIMGSLLQTDLIGLQVGRDVRRFKKALAAFSPAVSHPPVVMSFPIGIDFDSFNSPADTESVTKLAATLKKPFARKTVIFSLSRLDYTKGIITQLRAYERLLATHPERDIVYRLNVAPSRESMLEYRELREEVEALVSSINKRLGTKTWQPVVYSYDNMGAAEITAWYQIADIHLNTPIADGMNLIAKEYVAARKEPGVLIISSTMGAARQLQEALIVPPHAIAPTARALQSALSMPKKEKSRRWTVLRQEVEAHQASGWANDFLRSLTK